LYTFRRQVSFGFDKLLENARTVLEVIIRVSTDQQGNLSQEHRLIDDHGPGIKIDPSSVRSVTK